LFQNDSQESLEVLRDGRPLEISTTDASDYDSDHRYDDLLRRLIPPNFAQFYFFDGEKVRGVFNRPDTESISQAVRDLLALSYYERLIEDLKTYRRIKLPALYGKHQQKTAALQQKQGEREQIQGRVEELRAQLSELEDQLAELQEQLRNKDKEFIERGGIQQKELDSLKEQERQAGLEYEGITKQIKEALADQISACFLLPSQTQLQERLRREKLRRDWLLKRETIEPHVNELIIRIFGDEAPQPQPRLTREQTEFLKKRLAEEVKRLLWPPPADASEDIWFDLRDREVDLISEQFSAAAYFSSGTLKELIETKNRVYLQRKRIQEKLSGLGDSAITREISDQIKEINENIGRFKDRIATATAGIEHENKRLQEIEGEITILSRDCEKSAKGRQKEELAKVVEKVTEEYVEKAAAKKVADIEHFLNELFLTIANCRDTIREVKLNPQTYELKLIDLHGRERPMETGLSAGQAQVLAMSFVGALAKASGRRLPFIIDTPLGRLDVNHRRDVTEKFFAAPSPQTILLSTPTEINNCVYDERQLFLLDLLKPRVARAYTLIKKAPEETEVEENYFGNKFD
jgi:DNA sulfur modification protein DndD